MLFVEFFAWWYSKGLVGFAQKIGSLISRIWGFFSVPMLLRTLFAPWKRITTDPGSSIQEHTKALGDNAISRLVGFTVRIFVILAALVSIVVVAVVGLFMIIAWPLVPPAIVYFTARMVV